MVNNTGGNNSNNKARKRSKGKASRATPPPPPLDLAPVAEQRCYTQISVVPATCEWTITNFSRCQKEIGEPLVSPTFFGVANDKIKWCLALCPMGMKEESRDYLSLFLCRKSYDKLLVRAEYKFSILNEKREKTMTKKSLNAVRFMHGYSSGFQKFIRRDFVLDDRNGHLTDDKLTIFCEVRAVEKPVNISVHSNTAMFKVPECSFSKDLGQLFESRISSDVTLTVGEKEIPAHKAVLVARSPVFAAMFRHEMEETTGNRVEIADVNADALEEMLRFIYTGESTNLETMAFDLLPAADNYGLERLKVMCIEALCSGLSVENAAGVLIFADRHSIDHLKAQAIEFIKNHFAEVTKTSSWTSIMVPSHPLLLGEVFLALATQQIPPIGPSRKRRRQH